MDKILKTWQKSYNIGIPEIDYQHRIFFELMNNYHDRLKRGESKEAITEALSQLIDYVKFHFSEEEVIMKHTNSTNIEVHIKFHKIFIEKLTFLVKNVNVEPRIALNLLYFLQEWFIKHILIVDKHIGTCLKTESDTEEKIKEVNNELNNSIKKIEKNSIL